MANYKDTIRKSLLGSNPVTVLVLGICSVLAVTVHMKEALVMGIAVTLVSALSNLVVSSIRKTIPARIRIIVELLVVSFFVILADQLMKAYAYPESRNLSVYVGLIITNCIIMGRLEAFALSHKPLPSLMDGVMNGLGYGLVLVVVAFFRELLGSGTLWNHQVVPDSWYAAGYLNNGLMILPPMALILIGVIIWAKGPRVEGQGPK